MTPEFFVGFAIGFAGFCSFSCLVGWFLGRVASLGEAHFDRRNEQLILAELENGARYSFALQDATQLEVTDLYIALAKLETAGEIRSYPDPCTNRRIYEKAAA